MDNKDKKISRIEIDGKMIDIEAVPQYADSLRNEVRIQLLDDSLTQAQREKIDKDWQKKNTRMLNTYNNAIKNNKRINSKGLTFLANGGEANGDKKRKLTDSDLATIFGTASSILENKNQDVADSYIDGDSSADPIKRVLENFGIGDDGYSNAMSTISSSRTNYDNLNNDKSIIDAYDKSMNNLAHKKESTSLKDRMTDSLSASAKGAAAGAAFGPWGALIGGIAGGALNIADQFLRRNNIDTYNDAIDKEAEYRKNARNEALKRVRESENAKLVNSIFAIGGHIDSEESYRVEGDRHTADSMGVDLGDGNIVEGGEYVHNGYVFSDRITLNEEDCQNLGLPSEFAGQTFASIAEQIVQSGDEQTEEALEALKELQEFLNGNSVEEAQEEQQMQDMQQESIEDLGNPDEMNLTPEMFATGGELGKPYILRFINDFINNKEGIGKKIEDFGNKVKDSYLTNYFISYPESVKFPKGYKEEEKKRDYHGKNGDKITKELLRNHFEQKQEPNNRKEYSSLTGNGGVFGDYIEYGDDGVIGDYIKKYNKKYGDDYPSLDVYYDPIEREGIVIDVHDDNARTEEPTTKKLSKPRPTNRDNMVFDFDIDGVKYNSEYLDFIDSIDNDSFAKMKQDSPELFKKLGRDISLKDFKRLATDGNKGKVLTLAAALFDNNKYKAIEPIPSSGI